MYKYDWELGEKAKPLILDWLCSRNWKTSYNHSFKDRWINWDIWDNQLSVTLDFTVPEQKHIFDNFPIRFKGIKQKGTGKLVNKKTLYFKVDEICEVPYPSIIHFKKLRTIKHTDNDGDYFYVYEWEVFLEDDSSLFYSNQKDKMDMEKGDYIYNCRLQKRAFLKMIKAIQ